MQYLSRRPSGVYVFRLAVPSHLRHVFGKREVVVTTGTRELSIAKMVAGSLASQWLQHFNESDRLLAVANPATMHHQEILKIAQGHPILLGGGHMQLPHAAAASGISVTDLLRAAGKGSLALFVRSGDVLGHLLQFDALEPVDPAMGRAGGVVIPEPQTMPATAVEHIATGMLCVHPMDSAGVTAALITGTQRVELVAFELPGQPGMVFAPNKTVSATRETLEVAASEVEVLRRSVSSLIEPGQLGADCLFQIISHRYERGATLITTNRVYKQWASIFNNDAVLTSALLDRLLHHAETVRIEGKSYRSKDQVEV